MGVANHFKWVIEPMMACAYSPQSSRCRHLTDHHLRLPGRRFGPGHGAAGAGLSARPAGSPGGQQGAAEADETEETGAQEYPAPREEDEWRESSSSTARCAPAETRAARAGAARTSRTRAARAEGAEGAGRARAADLHRSGL